jgi:hypothetical protein
MVEGGARHAILKRRDDIVISCIGELSAALGEAPDVLVKTLPRVLLIVPQLPLLARARVRALEVADENPS